MNARTSTRPAPRPPAKPELSIEAIRRLLEPPAFGPGQYASTVVTWASAWAVCRPRGAGLEVIDVTATRDQAHALALMHSDAVAMFRALRLIQITEDF